jgi:flavin reductase (DIM6/NTAB) family NADH-FMN oxidoreductase RutF
MSNPAAEPDETQRFLAAALGRIPSGLFVLTFRSGKQETAMLGSWVQQCSFEPPQVVIALNQSRWMLDWLKVDTPVTVNILGEGQKDLMSHFAKGFDEGDEAFKGIAVGRTAEGAPAITAAHAFLDCRVTARHRAGDHLLIVARVVGGRVLHEGRPGVHIRRSGAHY